MSAGQEANGKSGQNNPIKEYAQDLIDDPGLLRELIENESPELSTVIDELKEAA